MAGRPRTMARNVVRLQTRFHALLEAFESIMPAQYRDREPPKLNHRAYDRRDALYEHWWRAWNSLYGAEDYLSDLASLLEWRATRHAALTTPDDAADNLNDDGDGIEVEAVGSSEGTPGAMERQNGECGPTEQAEGDAAQELSSDERVEPAATDLVKLPGQ